MIQDPTKPLIAVFEKYRHKIEPYTLFERFMEYVIQRMGIDNERSAQNKRVV